MRYRVILFVCLACCRSSYCGLRQRNGLSDWQVTCNNQNFCVARNTGEHHGLVMTLSRSAGARTDAVLRIDRGGLAPPDAKEAAIAPRLLLDGKPLSFNGPHWRVSPWHLMTGDPATITAFLQTIQDAQAITLKTAFRRFRWRD